MNVRRSHSITFLAYFRRARSANVRICARNEVANQEMEQKSRSRQFSLATTKSLPNNKHTIGNQILFIKPEQKRIKMKHERGSISVLGKHKCFVYSHTQTPVRLNV